MTIDAIYEFHSAVDEFRERTRPLCAKCGGGKRVDRVEIFYNIKDGYHEFVAYCHGEKDECRLPRDITLSASSIGRGVAFAGHEIGEPARELPEPQRRIDHEGQR